MGPETRSHPNDPDPNARFVSIKQKDTMQAVNAAFGVQVKRLKEHPETANKMCLQSKVSQLQRQKELALALESREEVESVRYAPSEPVEIPSDDDSLSL